MSISLEEAAARAEAKGYRKLVGFLTAQDGRIRIKQINRIVAVTDWKEVFPEENVLYFACSADRGEGGEGQILYFSDQKTMYEAAYQMLDILHESEKEWNEKVIDTNLKFNNITLKTPDIMKMILCFNEVMKNPIII